MRIAVLPGDGIGPEVTGAAQQLLRALAPLHDAAFEFTELPVGGISIDQHGVPLLPEVLDECRASDAVLLGAVGGPKWDSTDPDAPRPEQGLLGLRKGLELFANLRPVRVTDALLDASPLRPERVRGADLLIVRELTGGIYFGDRGRRDGVAHDTCVYSMEEIERIAELAFRLAAAPGRRGQVVSVDKANILETSRLWRETVERVAGAAPRRAARAHAGRQRRDAAGLPSRRLRRAPDREHVRRHPLRRGRDDRGLDRAARVGQSRVPDGPGLSSPFTARPPTSRAREAPIRSPPSGRWR